MSHSRYSQRLRNINIKSLVQVNIRANVDSSGKTEIPNLAMFHSISLNFVQLAEID